MKLKSIALLLALCASVSSASAANISYTGQFTYDNDVELFHFTIDTLSTVGLRTWSYAGGVNAAGQTIARGGFDPILGLFNAAGQLIIEQDDGGCTKVAADAVTRQCWDNNLVMQLAAGAYTVSLQQYNNFAVSENLADGFYYQGVQDRNFRNGFVDDSGASGDKRTSAWALDILNVNPAAVQAPADVPEPASLALMGAALVGMTAARRRRQATPNRA